MVNRNGPYFLYGGLALLLIAYLVLVQAYSYAIPFSKGPDEYINYQYILFIARHHRLPATLAEREEAGVKADWQPLYHLLGGLVAAPISLAPPPELKVTWQPPTRRLIDLVLPRATLVRTEDERPPYRGVYAVWQAGRWLSMALGAGTLVLTYLIGLAAWPGRPALALGATGLLVFMPRFLFTHAVLSDDTLLGFLLALYLWLLVRLWRGDRNPWLAAGAGLAAGLAIVTKYTAIPVVAGALLSGALLARWWGWSRAQWLGRGLLFAGALLLATGWWVGWVWRYFNRVAADGLLWGLIRPLLPGATVDDNPTTARLTALLSGESPLELGQAAGAGGSFVDWAVHTFSTLWGVTVFGAEPAWPYPYGALLVLLALLAGLALLGFGRLYRREAAPERRLWLLLGLHLALFFPLPLLRFGLSHRLNDAAQGRHILFPAGPAIALLLLAGWLAWLRPAWRNRLALAAAGLMLAWAVGHLVYLGRAYPPPLPVRTTPGPQVAVARPLRVEFGDIVRLEGYQARLAAGGRVLQLDLGWLSLAQAWEDYRTEIGLADPAGQVRLRWVSQPALGRLPVRAWQPGDMVRDRLFIPLPGLPPGPYEVRLRLLGEGGALATPQGEEIVLARLALPAADWPGPALWQEERVVDRPVYRYRASIPVTVPGDDQAALAGPDGRLRPPLSDTGGLRLFMVDHDWPSGEYRLWLDGQDSGLGLAVENFDRRPDGWTFTVPAMAVTTQANFDHKIELLGYDLPVREVKAGGGLPLVLYWRGLVQMRQDYTMFTQLLDAGQQRRGGYDRFPRENYNTYLWVPGEVVADGFAVPVDADAPAGVYTVRIGWYTRQDGQAVALPLVQNGQPLDQTSLVIGPVEVNGPPPGVVMALARPEHPLAVTLGQVIRLLGYDLSRQGRSLRLTLYWQSLAETNTDYTVFVHLQDEAGHIETQADGPPAQGRYPTGLWDPGEIIPHTATVMLPPAGPGRYRLAVGLYNPLTGQRLDAPGDSDSIILTEVRAR